MFLLLYCTLSENETSYTRERTNVSGQDKRKALERVEARFEKRSHSTLLAPAHPLLSLANTLSGMLMPMSS